MSTSWDIVSADGVNEKGLIANLLWLGESQYPKFDPKGRKKGVAISLWAQYFLDNFVSVNTGQVPDATAIAVTYQTAEEAFDSAVCILYCDL